MTIATLLLMTIARPWALAKRALAQAVSLFGFQITHSSILCFLDFQSGQSDVSGPNQTSSDFCSHRSGIYGPSDSDHPGELVGPKLLLT